MWFGVNRLRGVEAGELASAKDDGGEHGLGEAAGVGVAQGGVVGGEEVEAVGEGVLGGVGEAVGRFAGDDSAMVQVGEVAIEGDLAEADDDLDAAEEVDLRGEVGGAVADFVGEGLVGGRGAADDGGDPGVVEDEAVGAGDAAGLVGEAELVEDGVHEVAGAVAGEGASGAVGSVGSGGEAEEEDAGGGVAEAGDGAGPVDLVHVGAAADFADMDAVGAEAGAALAGDDAVADERAGAERREGLFGRRGRSGDGLDRWGPHFGILYRAESGIWPRERRTG